MSPKLVVGLAFGTGGVTMAGYTTIQYFRSSDIEIIDCRDPISDVSKAVCTQPSQKAKILSVQDAQYYVCTTIESPSTSGTTIDPALPPFTTDNNKATFTQKTSSDINTTPTKGTYKQNNQLSEIELYGYQKTDSKTKDIFVMKSSKPNSKTIDLSTHHGIRAAIMDIEQLRKHHSITISKPTHTEEIDSISCTNSKKTTIPNDQQIDYYICSQITDNSTTLTESNATSKTSTIFTNIASFKTKTGAKHTITKGSKTGEDIQTPLFYGFKPNSTTNGDKNVFFLIQNEGKPMTDTTIKDLIFQIKNFIK